MGLGKYDRSTTVRAEGWKNGFNDSVREKPFVRMNKCPKTESFADDSVGGRVRLWKEEYACQ